MPEKKLTIAGKRYTVRTRGHDSNLDLSGPGIVGGWVLPLGTTLDQPDLRAVVVAALAQYRANKKSASEYIQSMMRAEREAREAAQS